MPEDLLEQALQTAAGVDRAQARSLAYLQISEAYLEGGQPARSLEALSLADQAAQSLKYPHEKARQLAFIAGIRAQAGETAAADAQFKTAILLARASAPSEKTNALLDIAAEYIDAGFKNEAGRLLSETVGPVRLVGQSQRPEEEAGELTETARLYSDAGWPDQAAALLGKAAAVALTIKDNWFRAERLTEVAQAYAAAGDAGRAESTLERALPAAGLTELRECRPFLLLKMADVYRQAGQKEKARDILNQVLGIVDRDESAYSRSGDLIEVAERYWQASDPPRAVEILKRAREVIATIEQADDRAERLVQLTSILGKTGQSEAALEMAGLASDVAVTVTDKRARVHLQGSLAIVYAELHSRDEAAETVSGMIETVQQNRVKTAGLGPIACALSAAGEPVLALVLAQIIREPAVKVEALTAIAGDIFDAARTTQL